MWNLSGDDIERAKAELTGRRDAVQARYDNEMKQIEADLANIEMFERAAVSFVANFKHGEETAAAEMAPAIEPPAIEPETQTAEASPSPAEPVAEPPAMAAAADKPAGDKGSSRWRMRLSATETAS